MSTVARMRRYFRLPGTPRSSIRVIVDRLLKVAACRVAGLRTLEHIQEIFCHAIRGALLLVIVVGLVAAESNSGLTGRVVDPSDRAVPRAQIVVRNLATLLEHSAITNSEGIYEIRALPVGTYRLQVKSYTVERLTADVARTITQDVRLEIGDVSQEITVKSQEAPIDRATISVGHLIDGRTVQQLPLNGRYFLDLAVLSPGSVTASQKFGMASHAFNARFKSSCLIWLASARTSPGNGSSSSLSSISSRMSRPSMLL